MRRRDVLIAAGATVLAPLPSRGQSGERARRVGIFMDRAEDEPEAKARIAAFLRGLHEAGWTIGRDVRLDYRWRAVDSETMRAYATELVRLSPDVILGSSTPVIAALRRETRTIPIVFTTVADPVSTGFVESLARPGGNATGFTLFDHGMSVKWLEVLKEIAPAIRRVAVLHDSTSAPGVGQLKAIQAAARSFAVEPTPFGIDDGGVFGRALTTFAREPDGGVIVTATPLAALHRDRIITLAARHLLPAVYPYRHFVASGGLIAYGPDLVEPFRHAAGYVDRILKGAKPGELPVQAPTKFHMVVNLGTANTLKLVIPPSILARADEVIE